MPKYHHDNAAIGKNTSPKPDSSLLSQPSSSNKHLINLLSALHLAVEHLPIRPINLPSVLDDLLLPRADLAGPLNQPLLLLTIDPARDASLSVGIERWEGSWMDRADDNLLVWSEE